ncbi:hypothetical protein ACHAXS_006097 [Conticribra weissflogii]
MSASALEEEAAQLDGYFSDAPLDPRPKYPPLDTSFGRCVVISNLPKVPESKLDKLRKVVLKLVTRIGPLASYDDDDGDGNDDPTSFLLPFDPDSQSTVGCAFAEYESAGDAKKATEVLEGYKFDKNHLLKATLYTRAEELREIDEDGEFRQPAPEPYKEKPNTMEWLEDSCQRDEFAIRYGNETAVLWSDGKTDPAVDYDGAREKKAGIHWCDYYVQWSPKGSYFATLVPSKGVILWGGRRFDKLARFPARGVDFVVFSPQENYLMTNNNDRHDPEAIKVFSIQTGELLRAFPLYPRDFLPDDPAEAQQVPPPPFQWSHDDRYLARMGKDLISVFETPSMKLLDKRSLACDGIREFQFSPKANIIAYWAPEHKNQPAHVDLIEIPSRKKLRQKNLFYVTKCSMVWQEEGDYLGVKVTRHTKSKKTLYNNLELFRVNQPGIPVEMLDVKDAVMAFAWEPQGSRFAILHAENPTSTKVNVTFYDMWKQVDPDKKTNNSSGSGNKQPQLLAEVTKVHTLENKQCNCLFWSPAGRTILLAALGDSASGTLEFYDVDSRSLTVKEHYRANQVLWDPSGRTVATTVSQPIGGGHFKFAMDNGYILWTFQGKQIHQASFETFYQFQWRPRERLSSKAQIDEIAKNIKKYERQFNKFDEAKKRRQRLEETKGKRKLRSEFRATMARLREWRARQKVERMELLGGYDSEDEDNFVEREVVVETILSSKEELVY